MKDTTHDHEFRPTLHTTLTIGSHHYIFLPHPHLPGEVLHIPREQATTYQLQRVEDKTLWALKIQHQLTAETRRAQALRILPKYAHLPGLLAARRLYLHKQNCPELIAHFPPLEYAVLMPWIVGPTWAGFMDDPFISASYQQQQAYQLALTTAQMLWNLETNHIAHTDIAGDNVIVLSMQHIELIDLEGCYLPDIPAPTRKSRGWPGYQHPQLDQRGNYRPDGDRFAGAMLLTEMLTWWNSLVRATTPDNNEALFQDANEPTEQRERRLAIVRRTLWNMYPRLCTLFEQAWSSSDLVDCPDFSTWTLCLLEVRER